MMTTTPTAMVTENNVWCETAPEQAWRRELRAGTCPRYSNVPGRCGTESGLHARIAAALGWTVADAMSFSLPALRELVRPVDRALANEISSAIEAGALHL